MLGAVVAKAAHTDASCSKPLTTPTEANLPLLVHHLESKLSWLIYQFFLLSLIDRGVVLRIQNTRPRTGRTADDAHN